MMIFCMMGNIIRSWIQNPKIQNNNLKIIRCHNDEEICIWRSVLWNVSLSMHSAHLLLFLLQNWTSYLRTMVFFRKQLKWIIWHRLGAIQTMEVHFASSLRFRLWKWFGSIFSHIKLCHFYGIAAVAAVSTSSVLRGTFFNKVQNRIASDQKKR